MRPISQHSVIILVTVAALLAGCGPGATPNGSGLFVPVSRGAAGVVPAFTTPALIAFDTQNGALGYWPIKRGGGRTLQSLSGPLGIYSGYAMAANGNVMIIANYSPAEVMTYNVKTKAQKTMGDPYGQPYDVAVDKKRNIYALSPGSVAVYKAGSSTPSQLTCSHISSGQAVAVDNEGDVFVNGYGPSFMGVVEYPAGSRTCQVLHLRTELGYAGGVGIDPKTDDLIVVDDPDLCAGGIEGRMIIYPKPYKARTSIRRILGATYCAGIFRLDANSEHIFYSDSTVSAGFPLIDESRYPSAKAVGVYMNGYYSNGNFAGFTTIPNTLPN